MERLRWLVKLGRECGRGRKAYDGSAREVKKLLPAASPHISAEEQGLPDVAAIRHGLALKLGGRRAAQWARWCAA